MLGRVGDAHDRPHSDVRSGVRTADSLASRAAPIHTAGGAGHAAGEIEKRPPEIGRPVRCLGPKRHAQALDGRMIVLGALGAQIERISTKCLSRWCSSSSEGSRPSSVPRIRRTAATNPRWSSDDKARHGEARGEVWHRRTGAPSRRRCERREACRWQYERRPRRRDPGRRQRPCRRRCDMRAR